MEPRTGSQAPLPLDGIRVVDLSRLVSGNLLTHALADLGAAVLEIENPHKGDDLRNWQREGVSTYWLAYSRNKKSVALDLRDAADMARLQELLGDAYILVEDCRPGTLERKNITAGAICDIADLMTHPYFTERGLLVEQPTPYGRSMPVHAVRYRINGERPPVRRPASTLGQDTARWFLSDKSDDSRKP